MILGENNFPFAEDWETRSWRGTPELTLRRSQLASLLLFILGDAAGYVEPFTGEGIAWALTSGARVVPFVLEGIRQWDALLATQWTRLFSRLIGRRQSVCWGVTRILRGAALTRFAARIFSWKPSLATPFVQWMNAPFKVEKI